MKNEFQAFEALCRQLGITHAVIAYTQEDIEHDALPYYAPEVLHQARWSCVLGQTSFYFDHQGAFLVQVPVNKGWKIEAGIAQQPETTPQYMPPRDRNSIPLQWGLVLRDARRSA